MVQSLWKTVCWFLKKLEIAIPFLDINTKELKARAHTPMSEHGCVYTSDMCNSIIHNSQKVQTAQASAGAQMDKHNVDCTYSGTLISLQKEGNPGICYNLDEH